MTIRKQLEPFPGPWKGHERERPWDSGCMGFTINMHVCQRETERECVCAHGPGIFPPEPSSVWNPRYNMK